MHAHINAHGDKDERIQTCNVNEVGPTMAHQGQGGGVRRHLLLFCHRLEPRKGAGDVFLPSPSIQAPQGSVGDEGDLVLEAVVEHSTRLCAPVSSSRTHQRELAQQLCLHSNFCRL